ncbi:hypothetical protein GA0115240_103212, partial [Streptomyces sp. DvalAA-14]
MSRTPGVPGVVARGRDRIFSVRAHLVAHHDIADRPA